MEKSLFFRWLANTFSAAITRFSNTINGQKGEDPKYLFMQYLKKNYSLSLTWESLNGNGRTVAADVVALDSSVPLKRRASLAAVKGDVPKIGMKKRKSEKEMQELQILEATNQNGNRTAQILGKLFNDPISVTQGVYERLEFMFLEGLSKGVTSTTDENNEGVEIRIDYGYSPNNIFGADTAWSDPAAKPLDDINRIVDGRSANGYGTSYMFMDRLAWNNFRSKQDVRELYAAAVGFGGANAPTPNFEQANNALVANGLPQIVLIDRSINIEKNGIITAVKPWAPNAVVFTDTLDLGDITWSDLVEKNNPSKNVLYAVADQYILVSTWHTNDPFAEFTSSQALVLPVINNVNGITVLNSEEADTDVQTEGDANFTYKATAYTKASVVAGLNATGEVAESTTTQKDSTLLAKINKLSEAGIALFEAELVEAE